MTTFSNRQERLAFAGHRVPNRIRYTHEAEGATRQPGPSHVDQNGRANQKWGEISPEWCWEENGGGMRCDRPAFRDLLEFCREHPRSIDDPGRIEMFNPSVVGAQLGGLEELECLSWHIEFVTVSRPNTPITDMITELVFPFLTSELSRAHSLRTREGIRRHAEDGWWTGGPAPWGTVRYDTRTGRTLTAGQASVPGDGGTILRPDGSVIRYWEVAARAFLSGATVVEIAELLRAERVRGPRGGRLGSRAVRHLLTNLALIGETKVPASADHAGITARPARWGAMVDVELFRQVQEEMDRRASQSEGQTLEGGQARDRENGRSES